MVSRKLHPQGGSVPRNVSGESLCGSAETIPVPVPCDDDGMFSRASLTEGWTRDETGSCCAVKGDVDACDPPPEARVPRLDRCCYEQKVGYGRHATHHTAARDPSRPPRGPKKFRASSENFFFREISPLDFPIAGDLSHEDGWIPKNILDFCVG